MREDDHPAHDRRAGNRLLGADRDRRRRTSRTRSARPGRGDGVPELRALPAHDRVDNIAFGLKLRACPKAEIDGARQGGRRGAGHRASSWTASRASCRAASSSASPSGARSSGAARVPAGRAVQQPRRCAARADADGAEAPAPRAAGPRRLRDPRPGGGDDAVRPHRRHARRQPRAVRHAAGDLRQAAQHLRGHVRRASPPSTCCPSWRRSRGIRSPCG